MAETRPAKIRDHVLHKLLPRETREDQPSTQRRCGEGNERRITSVLLSLFGEGVADLKVLEIREESNKIQDFTGRTSGVFESEKSESRGEVSKALLNGRHEARYLETVYPELLEVFECGEITEGGRGKSFGGEFNSVAYTKLLDGRK